MSHKPNPRPDERVCFNCHFQMPVIGGMRGWLCRKPPPGKRGVFLIPSRFYTCDRFEPRPETPPQSLTATDEQASLGELAIISVRSGT